MALPNSDNILRAVIEATPDAIFVKDLEGRYVLVNAAAARFLGKSPEEIVGRRDLELYSEETARRFIEDDQLVLTTGRAHSFEGIATGDAGATQAYLVTKGVYRDAAGRILGLFGISHDITELRQAHETLAHTREALFVSQKLEAVGQLTGGVAHDFNNILAIILGNLELLQMAVPKKAQTDEIIQTVCRATMHGKELISHLLAFSRRRMLNPQPVDINAHVVGVVRLLSRTLGGAVRITTVANADAGTALVDPASLEAALLNIALNARDAMPEGGSLTIRTSRIDIDDPSVLDYELSPGAYGVLALEDTGCGMPEGVAARAFEPFYTTKKDHGTGLGLSMVYGFVKQSGGTVTIVSAPGRGTTITMYLPLTSDEPQAAEAEAPEIDEPVAPCTILVVEDEADVRHVVRRQLESLGHHVLAAEAATEALLLVSGPGAPDLLLTDVMLPIGMNGLDLAKAARERRPGLRVIFMSGYTAVPEAQRRIRDAGAPFLAKPFTTAQLESAVNAAMR